MDTLSYKTISANAETVQKEWVVVDATDQILGRHVDCGDNVIIINADKCKMTGKKWTEHQYVRYTGYPGGQRFTTPAALQAKSEKKKDLRKGMHPLYLQVIKGMLPKNRLGAQLLKNVHIYNGPEHPHEAQQPKVIDINKLK